MSTVAENVSVHRGSCSGGLSAPDLSVTRDNTNSDEQKDEDRGPFTMARRTPELTLH